LPERERRERKKEKREDGGVRSGREKTSAEDWRRQGQLQKTLKISAR